ncbi:MAG: hypothetical protein MRY64_04835 [Hyphomonadaceae bacterium]|nr:hypothetical protein [Hyphomonadaceae bacterium]
MQTVSEHSHSLLARRALVPIALIQMALALFLHDLPGLPDTASIDGAQRPPELPPAEFFVPVWVVIFAGYTGFAIWAWREEVHVTLRLATPLAVVGVGCIFTLGLQASNITSLAALPVLTGTGLAAALACQRFDQMRGMGGSPGKWVADLTTGLICGWLALTVTLGLMAALRAMFGLGQTDAPWQMLLLTLILFAGLVWLCFHRVTRSPYLILALLWGLAGIVANLWWQAGLNAPAVIVGIFSLWLIRRRLRFGASGAKALPT